MENNPFESLHSVMAFDPRDWSLNPKDAWIYGIVAGWGDKASYKELREKHGWSISTTERLHRLHREFTLQREKGYE